MHPQITDLAGVAEMIGAHPRTVATRARNGEIPGARVGAAWRFWRPAVLSAVVGEAAARHASSEVNMADEPQIITPKELTELLGVGQLTVMSLIHAGKIPATKIGGRYRIFWPAIRDAIAAGRPLNHEGDQ